MSDKPTNGANGADKENGFAVTGVGSAGDPRMAAGEGEQTLTTRQGHPVYDNQNLRTVGSRGPTTLENYHFIEKITHFDRERIPERVVHARGAGAQGYFEAYGTVGDDHLVVRYVFSCGVHRTMKHTYLFLDCFTRFSLEAVCAFGISNVAFAGLFVAVLLG